jgi:SAM-dependent methyltransferase
MLSPLTSTKNVTLLERVPVTRLIDEWASSFSIDITNQFRDISTISKYRCDDTGLIFFAPAEVAGSDWLYEQLQRLPWYYHTDKWEHRVALGELAQCQSVLEIGCGTGEFIQRLNHGGRKVTGIEFNTQAAAQAREAGLEVFDTARDDLREMYRDSFEAVCSFQVLEHVSDPAAFVQEALAFAKPGGKVVLAVPNSAGFEGLGYDLLQYPPHHMSWWTSDCFRALERLFPIRLEKAVAEPLAAEHVSNYLTWTARHLRERSRNYRWLFNRRTLAIYRQFLAAGLRRFCTGHALYAQFVRV